MKEKKSSDEQQLPHSRLVCFPSLCFDEFVSCWSQMNRVWKKEYKQKAKEKRAKIESISYFLLSFFFVSLGVTETKWCDFSLVLLSLFSFQITLNWPFSLLFSFTVLSFSCNSSTAAAPTTAARSPLLFILERGRKKQRKRKKMRQMEQEKPTNKRAIWLTVSQSGILSGPLSAERGSKGPLMVKALRCGHGRAWSWAWSWSWSRSWAGSIGCLCRPEKKKHIFLVLLWFDSKQ